ncbi:MAG: hypothetical protein ACTTG8_09310 [Catonella sp.]|uniref:hypothetical protein n=1 Tax=Catonella sp. TaxID=2382125 RepID=UPI003F9EE0F7
MKKKSLLAIAAAVIILSSCDSMPKEIKAGDVSVETLYMRADGSGQVAYVEDFTEKYFNIEELKGYIAAELISYNKQYGDKVIELSDIELKNSGVTAVLTFKDEKVYADFNKARGDNNVKFPKAAEALTEFADALFKEADSKEDINKKASEVLSDDYNIAVVNGFLNFQTGKKIKYYYGGTLIDTHHFRVDEGKTAVVVYSK